MLKRLKPVGVMLPFLFPSFVSILFYIYLGSFSRLIADDYCSLSIARKFGVLRSIWFWYIHWHGCYSAALVDNILVLSPYTVQWAPLTVLTTWLAFLIWSGYELFSEFQNPWERFWKTFSAGCVLLLGALLMQPSLSQSLLWWGGLRSYTLSLVFTTLAISFFIWINQKDLFNNKRFVSFLIGLWIAFFCAGFTESLTPTLLVFWCAITATGTKLGWQKSRSGSWAYSSGATLGALIGLVVVILAPGNAERQAFSPAPPDLITLLTISFQAYCHFIQIGLGLRLAGYLLSGIFGFAVWLGISMPVRQTPLWWAPLAGIGGFILGFGFFPPAAYGLRESLPERSQVLPVFCLMVGLIFAGVLFGRAIASRKILNSRVSHAVYWAACFLLLAAIWINFQKLTENLIIVERYATYWDVTYQQIRMSEASGAKTITIHSVRNWAALNDPGDNPKFWINQCMSECYGITVRADGSGMQHGLFIK
jgi:hypothetical protein